MPRPAHGRRARLVATVVCLAALAGAIVSARARADRPAKYSRLQRLEQWTTALERHQPGEADAALNVFADWNAREFAELKITFYSALQLVRDPRTRTFVLPGNTPTARARQVFYARDEIRLLLDLAKRLRELGEKHLLHRGAMLHMDAVVLGTGSDSRDEKQRSEFFVFRFDDGQGLNNQEALGQWDVARFLLDNVRSDPKDFLSKPQEDDWVRRWYCTLVAFMLYQQHFNVNDAAGGLALFPDDPELLFLAATLHETLAMANVQEPLRRAEKTRLAVGVKTTGAELDEAENLLRRALKVAPSFAEARLHLGKVLGDRGQHKEALPALAQALSVIKNQDLLYYGQLFTGRSAAALGQRSEARAAFERAATLKPTAQSPLLAMSQLAYSGGDADEAAALLARVAALPSLETDDPWWFYSVTVGRFFKPSHEQIVESLRQEMPK